MCEWMGICVGTYIDETTSLCNYMSTHFHCKPTDIVLNGWVRLWLSVGLKWLRAVLCHPLVFHRISQSHSPSRIGLKQSSNQVSALV